MEMPLTHYLLTGNVLMCMLLRCIMRTNVDIDDPLINEAIRLSGTKTKKDAISLALQEFVETKKRLNLLDLEGKIRFRDDYDYKALRENKGIF
jgi:Arc/MetJ family transcription regulator